MDGPPNAPFQEPTDARSGYAMQSWVPRGYDGEFYGAGAFGQYRWIDRRRDVVLGQFASQLPGDVEEREHNPAFRVLVAAVRRMW